MVFHVDFKSGKPVYLQLVDQVRYAAASGALRAGDALPSIRPLAEELHVNRNTVAKAYTELENLGIIETIGGKGCFLKENESPLTQQARDKLLRARIDEAVITAHQMQVGAEELKIMLEERIQYFDRKRGDAMPQNQEKEPTWTTTNPSSTLPISTDVMESWTPSTD